MIAATRQDCDLCKQNDLVDYIVSQKPDVIINCAAISGIESCLDDPVACHYVNVMAPQTMAQVSQKEGIKLIHLSTDYVLDGRRPGLKTEQDKIRPINTYGESKAEAEWRVMDECPSSVIARVSWVFGSLEKPGFAEAIWNKLLKGESISAVGDKDSIPTWLPDLVEWLTEMIELPSCSGIYQLCNSGEPLTWSQYAQLVIDAAYNHGAIDKKPVIEVQKLDEMSHFRDARPRYTAMSCQKLANLLDKPIRSYEEAIDLAIQSYVARLKDAR